MEESRRGLLKASGITAATLLAPGVGARQASASGPETKVRLRGTLSNPIPSEKVGRAKARVVEDHLADADVDAVPNVRRKELPDDSHIVAYNFDVIDGEPFGWAAIVADPAKGHQRPDDLAKVRRERVANAHRKAERNANERAQLRRQTDDGTSTQDVSTQSTDDWSDWNTAVHERDSYTGSDGNETGYTIDWKTDPSKYSDQGVEAETRMYPCETDQWTSDWQNRWASPYFDYNGSVIDYVEDYGPGNSVGSVTETISLSLSSDKVVEVGASKSNTSSNVDIDNHSNTDSGDYVNQKFSISGDLKGNTVRVNQSASTVGTSASSGSTYCNIDLKAKYRWGDCCQTMKHTIPYELYWK